MAHPSRPPSRSDGLTAVTASEGSGGDAPTVGAAGASTRTSRTNSGGERRFGHPEHSGGAETESRCRARATSTCEGRGVRYMFQLFRRSSSGYFSSEGDSLPSSPLSPVPVTVARASQTPHPTGQVLNHALRRMAEAHGAGPRTQQQQQPPGERRHFAYVTGSQLSPSSSQQHNAAGDMQAVEVGRELRRIGDDFNNHLLAVAGRHRWVAIQPVRVPHVLRESAVLLCVGLLLFVIGRIIYSQGGSSLQGRSQV